MPQYHCLSNRELVVFGEADPRYGKDELFTVMVNRLQPQHSTPLLYQSVPSHLLKPPVGNLVKGKGRGRR